MKRLSYCSVLGEIARHPEIVSWKRNTEGDCLIVRCEGLDDAASLALLLEGHNKGRKAYIPIIKGLEYCVEEVYAGQQMGLF